MVPDNADRMDPSLESRVGAGAIRSSLAVDVKVARDLEALCSSAGICMHRVAEAQSPAMHRHVSRNTLSRFQRKCINAANSLSSRIPASTVRKRATKVSAEVVSGVENSSPESAKSDMCQDPSLLELCFPHRHRAHCEV